ncbi:MAG: hypothetical protein U9P42_00080 [Candidatus Fermentibacteria bacterium]|nr:hypothetical protein [Candidatus Fermentibacteria bacterium]
MNMLFVVFCLVSQPVDTLWTVDFSSTSGEWIAGPQWQWLDDSAFLDIECGYVSSGYDSNEDSLISPTFIVPENADSLVGIFDHYWWGHGNRYGAPLEWAKSTSYLLMYSSARSVAIELWEVFGLCEDSRIHDGSRSLTYSVFDSGYVFIPLLDVSAGDSLSFVFKGLVEAYVQYGSAQAFIEWNLFTFTILNYPDVALERYTWGAIKAAF